MPAIDSKTRDKMRRVANSLIETGKVGRSQVVALVTREVAVSPDTVKKYLRTMDEGGLLAISDDGSLNWTI